MSCVWVCLKKKKSVEIVGVEWAGLSESADRLMEITGGMFMERRGRRVGEASHPGPVRRSRKSESTVATGLSCTLLPRIMR